MLHHAMKNAHAGIIMKRKMHKYQKPTKPLLQLTFCVWDNIIELFIYKRKLIWHKLKKAKKEFEPLRPNIPGGDIL